MSQVLGNSANSGSSYTTGENSVLSGNSNLRQNMSMNTDSVTSSGAASTGLPASPLSFTSSNVSFPGSSGLGSSSLLQPAGTSFTMLESQQDPNTRPTKLLKFAHVPLSNLGHQSVLLQRFPDVEDLEKHTSQPHDVHNVGLFHQTMNSNLTGKSSGMRPTRIGHESQGLTGAEEGCQNRIQHAAQLHATMAAAKHNLLQQQAARHMFQMPSSVLSTQLHQPEALQHQPQHLKGQLLQQRLLHQQQILRMMSPQFQQAHYLQQQHQHQLQWQQQIAGLTKQSPSASGACVRRLMQFMYHQRTRPTDNNIGFWRDFTSEYFAPHARKRWCLSHCGAGGGCQPIGAFPQDLWRCEICGSNPGRGFEATTEIMPRLFMTKYDNDEHEELLFVDLPYEYTLSSGITVLEYGKAVQESAFEHFRVVTDGQLRIVFTWELKILSWDFCAKSHEELLPRQIVVPQVNQLVMLSAKYQSSMSQTNGAALPAEDLQASCNMFLSSARYLAKITQPSSVNEIGFTKRFVRFIQIAEVVNCMRDLIDFSLENNVGPIESLLRFSHQWYTSGKTGGLLTQADPSGFVPLVADQNNNTLNSIQLDVDKQMNKCLSRRISSQVNPHSNVQSVLHKSSNLHRSAIQPDPYVFGTSSGCGSLSSSVQASPTSSLTSFQTSVSSLTANREPNPVSSDSVNLIPQQQCSAQPLQCRQQNADILVHHLLHEMMNSHSRNDGNLQQGKMSTGFKNGSGNVLASGLTGFSDHGLLGTDSADMRNYMMGASSTLAARIGDENVSRSNRLQCLSDSLPHMVNIGTHHTLGTRLDFASLVPQQELHLQDNNGQQDLDLGGSNDFGNHPYNWY